MEQFHLERDIHLICVQASSFPHGVGEAHQKIHAAVPFGSGRRYFGISRPENGGSIVYKAAAEELHSGEAEQLGFESFTVKKGAFVSITLHDYVKDTPAIGKAFHLLITQPGIDPQGYCLEWYVSDAEVRCMVPLE
ncbi:MAG: transcriptional regulator [Bacteroidetes bacterium]|nr:transcriptional regulator [Bacteroidota bacterium]